MKRFDRLIPDLLSWQGLIKAYRRARKGCGSTVESETFGFYLEPELLKLQDELKSGRYRPGDFRYFRIFEPKERIISVAPFRDRVVHHALIAILEKIYEPRFYFHSYATRRGKGNHKAIQQAQVWVRGYRCFFKSDIEKYFESIDHEILISLLRRRISDQAFLSILEGVIQNGGEQGKGLPIGNLTSQFLANVYLNPLDQFIKQKLSLRGYIRYMDDFVCFHQEKKVLKEIRREIEKFLEDELLLKLKPAASYFGYASSGLSFLGARIFPALIRIKPENFHRAKRRMQKKYELQEKSEIEEDSFYHSMNSYWAYLASFDTLGFRKQMIKEGF